MVDRTRSYRDGEQVHDPARRAQARLADRGKRRLAKLALVRGARWRRCVLGAMMSGVAVLAALQFMLGRPPAAPVAAGDGLAAVAEAPQPQPETPGDHTPG